MGGSILMVYVFLDMLPIVSMSQGRFTSGQ